MRDHPFLQLFQVPLEHGAAGDFMKCRIIGHFALTPPFLLLGEKALIASVGLF